MRRLLTAFCLCFCTGLLAESVDTRLHAFGFVPAQNKQSQPWSEQELGQILHMLENLPSAVRQVIEVQQGKPLRLYKNHQRPRIPALFKRHQQLNMQITEAKKADAPRQ